MPTRWWEESRLITATRFACARHTLMRPFLFRRKKSLGGVAFALEKHRLVVEGGGAVGIAALLSGKVSRLSGKVAVVVSGGNIDIPLLLQIVREYGEEAVPSSK